MNSSGSFSLVRFWGRRAKRLLPNALCVLAVISAAAFLTGPKLLTEWLPGDLATAALYVSNYRFAARATDYFDGGTISSPALHFWSLSVEEQYYVLIPALIFLLSRRSQTDARKTVLFIAFVMTALSIGSCLYWVIRSQPDAFFRTDPRLWQIGAGSILACTLQYLRFSNEALSKMLSWSGLVVLLAATLLLSNNSPYPSFWAAVPVLATLAILASRTRQH